MAAELLSGNLRIEVGKAKLLETRRKVERGWCAVGDFLARDGGTHLTAQIRQFVAQMQPPVTEREAIAQMLRARARRTDSGSISYSVTHANRRG